MHRDQCLIDGLGFYGRPILDCTNGPGPVILQACELGTYLISEVLTVDVKIKGKSSFHRSKPLLHYKFFRASDHLLLLYSMDRVAIVLVG